MNYREKMREYLKEPNEICNHYGKWGILNKEQRDLITRLLNEMDGADNYINNLQQENARLKDNCKQLEKFICYEQDRLLKATSHIYQDSFDKIKLVNSDIFEELKKVENKMKELFKEN